VQRSRSRSTHLQKQTHRNVIFKKGKNVLNIRVFGGGFFRVFFGEGGTNEKKFIARRKPNIDFGFGLLLIKASNLFKLERVCIGINIC
jgi:hypothetical protein